MEIKKPFVKKLFPPRDKLSRKGDFGRVLVVGGSRLYSGSPALAGLASLKAGADLAYVFAPKRAADIAASFSPDLITFPARGDFLNSWHLGEALKMVNSCDSLVVGCGAETRNETQSFFEKLIEKNSKPSVIDADALKFISNNEHLIKDNHVLTPHAGEFHMLSGKQPSDNLKERQGMVQRLAKKLNCTILLKGYIDVISDGNRTVVNKSGNPFMTVGGTGDVLAGVCGSLLARVPPFEAAAAAAWISGTAGDLAAKELGPSMTASDMLESVYKAFK